MRVSVFVRVILRVAFFAALSFGAKAQCPTVATARVEVCNESVGGGTIRLYTFDGVTPVSYILFDLSGPTAVSDPFGPVTVTILTSLPPGGVAGVEFGGVPDGDYLIRLNCSPSGFRTIGGLGINVNSSLDLKGLFTLNRSDCDPGSVGTGELSLAVSDGRPPYAIQWSGPTSIPNGSIPTSGGSVTTPNNLNAGVYIATITDANNCVRAVNFLMPIATVPNAGTDFSICGVSSTNLNATAVGPLETGTWTGPGGVTFSNVNSPTSTVSNLPIGATTLRWTITAPGCPIGNFDEVVVTRSALPIAVINGSTTVCQGDPQPLVTFTGSLALPDYTFTYTINGGSNQVASTTGGSSSVSVSAPTATPGTFVYELVSVIDANGCSQPQTGTVNVVVNAAATANAGPAQTICAGSTVTLAGVIGGSATSATWSGGTGTFAPNATTLNAVYTPSASEVTAGTVTLTLTTNDPAGPCVAATSTVTLTINAAPVASVASNSPVCQGGVLNLTSTGGVSYAWSGPNGFTSTNPTPSISNIGLPAAGTYSVTVTGANTCQNSASTVVSVNVLPTTSIIIGNTTLCENTNSVSYSVTNTTGSTYAWIIAGGTQATGGSTNSITVNWGSATSGSVSVTETNAAGCLGTPINLSVSVLGNPTTSNAGPDQTNVACSATLNGNSPAVGVGQWVFATGGNTDGLGVIVSPANRQSAFNGTPGVTYTLRWRIANGPCVPSTDDVQIGFDPAGVTPAQAGVDQSLCGSGSFTLTGNTPTVGTGAWSVVGAANGATITNPTAVNSTVTGLQAGASVTLRWTITNSTCSSFDDLVLTHVVAPTIALAGSDQNVCASSTTLTANAPTTGTGFWTIVSGTGGTVAIPSNPASSFSGSRGTAYTLRWTITNGGCPASTDDVQITLDLDATTASAGPDQSNVCGTVALAGNSPTVGIGSWSFAQSNTGTGGNIVAPANAASSFNGAPGQTYVLRWSISNGACVSNDEVQIQLDPVGVSAANAGPDQSACGTSTALAATVPTTGTGVWSFATGGNPDGLGSIADVAAANTSFSGTVNIAYQLVWTVTSGACVSADQVNVTFLSNPSVANAGTDIELCNTGTFTVAGNLPAVGAGAWSIVSGTATIVSPTQANSLVTGVSSGSSVTLRWTISNGTCSSSADEVVITNTALPSTANAGADVAQCPSPNFTLAATSPTVGVGTWTVVSGTANIANSALTNSGVSGISVGSSATLRWTVSNGICPASTDDVQLSLCTGGVGTGTCATVVITPLPSPATCTNSDGRIVFRIRPFVPAVNPDGVKISITGVSPTNQTISRTNFNDSTFANLPIGSYDYVIEYGSVACIKTGQVTIDRSGTVGVPVVTNIVSPRCFGEATGALTLDVPGETGNVLQWSFDGGITDPWKDFTAGNQVSGIPAGPAPSFERVISVRRNASDPCFSSAVVAIPETATAITATLIPSNATCNNNDGSITITGLPGGPFTYALNGTAIALPANGIIASLSANNYTLRVTNASGCFKDFSTTIAFPGFVPTTTPVVTPPDCTGGGLNGTISFSITTSGSYTVGVTQDPIAPPTSFFNPGGLNVTLPNLTSGFWYVWIRPAGVFCETKLGPLNLSGTVPVAFDLAATDEVCFGSAGSVQLTRIRGAQNLPFAYELIRDGVALPIGTITFAQSVSAFTIPGLTPGQYRIQLAQNQSGLVAACTAPIASAPRTFTITGPTRALDTLYVQREISLPDQPTGSMRIGIQESTFEPYEIRVELVTPVFPAQNFLMDWRAAARNPQTLRLEMVVNNLYAGLYKVALRDARGCEKEYSVEVKVDTALFVPNIFTPNGDGFNDTFFIRNLPTEATLEITNRWGKSVFQSGAYQNDWDGAGISEGLYFYRLSFGGQAVTGWVELLRGTGN